MAKYRFLCHPRVIAAATFLTFVGLLAARPAPTAAEPAGGPLPFAAGEQLTFRVSVAGMGTIGRGSMSVDDAIMLRSRRVLPLRFEFRTRIGPARAEDRTQSWLDSERMSALRFWKFEQHPLSSRREQVELFPGQRSWVSADGVRGVSPTDAPLDELSFLYFVRTLPLEPGASYQFDRHFDPARNPVGVQVLRRETVKVPAGEFETLLVQMTVKDPRRYEGVATLRLFITDDARRMPVRMESSIPVFGRMVLVLESSTERR